MGQVGSTINNGYLAGNHAEVGQVQAGHDKVDKGMHHTGTFGAFPETLTLRIQNGCISRRNQGGIGQTNDGWRCMICRFGTRGLPRTIPIRVGCSSRKGGFDKVGGTKQLPPGWIQGALGVTIQKNNRHVIIVLVVVRRKGWCRRQGQKCLEPISKDKIDIAIVVAGNQQDTARYVMGADVVVVWILRSSRSRSGCAGCCGSTGRIDHDTLPCSVVGRLHNFQMVQNVVNIIKVWSLSFLLLGWTLLLLLLLLLWNGAVHSARLRPTILVPQRRSRPCRIGVGQHEDQGSGGLWVVLIALISRKFQRFVASQNGRNGFIASRYMNVLRVELQLCRCPIVTIGNARQVMNDTALEALNQTGIQVQGTLTIIAEVLHSRRRFVVVGGGADCGMDLVFRGSSLLSLLYGRVNPVLKKGHRVIVWWVPPLVCRSIGGWIHTSTTTGRRMSSSLDWMGLLWFWWWRGWDVPILAFGTRDLWMRGLQQVHHEEGIGLLL